MVDIILSILVLIIFLPLILLIIILLFFAKQGKIFFIQKRPGKNEKIFNLIKFKTMNDKNDENRNLLPAEVQLLS